MLDHWGWIGTNQGDIAQILIAILIFGNFLANAAQAEVLPGVYLGFGPWDFIPFLVHTHETYYVANHHRCSMDVRIVRITRDMFALILNLPAPVPMAFAHACACMHLCLH